MTDVDDNFVCLLQFGRHLLIFFFFNQGRFSDKVCPMFMCLLCLYYNLHQIDGPVYIVNRYTEAWA